MKTKKLLALALGASMVMGNSMVAFAADQEGAETATGTLEYVKQADVFSVVLPTDAGTTFDYVLDPGKLIQTTEGAKYAGKTFDAGKTVYFLHAEKVDGTPIGGTAGSANCDYSDTSDEIKVINKSTKPVDLKVTAKIAEATGVTMASSTTVDATNNLYMAIIGSDNETTPNVTTKALTTTGVELDANIAADATAYEVTYDTTAKEYKKTLTDAAKADGYSGFKTYTFKLTGAAFADDINLLALKENPPKIDLTWSVKDFTQVGKPSIATRSYTLAADTAVDITVDLGTVDDLKATTVTSVKWKEANLELLNNSKFPNFVTYTAADTKITLPAASVNSMLAKESNLPATLIVTFDDASKTSVNVKLTK